MPHYFHQEEGAGPRNEQSDSSPPSGAVITGNPGCKPDRIPELIVNHLTEHGVIDAALLYESPFIDLSPQGPEGLFTSPQLDELVLVLEDVYAHAVG